MRTEFYAPYRTRPRTRLFFNYAVLHQWRISALSVSQSALVTGFQTSGRILMEIKNFALCFFLKQRVNFLIGPFEIGKSNQIFSPLNFFLTARFLLSIIFCHICAIEF